LRYHLASQLGNPSAELPFAWESYRRIEDIPALAIASRIEHKSANLKGGRGDIRDQC
jgi:hypothetical protein